MAVFTSVGADALAGFLTRYDLGTARSLTSIPTGIENTNYFLATTAGEYVLTLFERVPAAALPFFLDLTAFLAARDIPCARPLADRAGRYLGELAGKPAVIATRLPGRAVTAPLAAHCAAVGGMLARLHLAGAAFAQTRDNDFGPRWQRRTAAAVMARLAPDDAALLADELHFQSLYRLPDLPRGIVHGDLFRDNVLFDGARLCGLLDFYYACTDAFLFDVAVCVNDWCVTADGGLDAGRAHALLSAYHAARPLSAIERGAWPVSLRAAALRFWLSRLYDACFPRPGEITHIKDPAAFKRILLHHVGHEHILRDSWPRDPAPA